MWDVGLRNKERGISCGIALPGDFIRGRSGENRAEARCHGRQRSVFGVPGSDIREWLGGPIIAAEEPFLAERGVGSR